MSSADPPLSAPLGPDRQPIRDLDFQIAERSGATLAEVLAMPVWEWQAWAHRCRTDPGGLRGLQQLVATLVAVTCSSEERPVDWREIAPWLAPRWAEFEEQRFRRQVKRRAPALLRFRGQRLRDEWRRLTG